MKTGVSISLLVAGFWTYSIARPAFKGVLFWREKNINIADSQCIIGE